MVWAFGTWDAQGRDNNTGLVKINVVATMWIDGASNYAQAFPLPSGYTLDYMFQPGGEKVNNDRKRISVQGNVINVTQSPGAYDGLTFPNVPGLIIAFVR